MSIYALVYFFGFSELQRSIPGSGIGLFEIELPGLAGHKMHPLEHMPEVGGVLIAFLVMAQGCDPHGAAVEVLIPGCREVIGE